MTTSKNFSNIFFTLLQSNTRNHEYLLYYCPSVCWNQLLIRSFKDPLGRGPRQTPSHTELCFRVKNIPRSQSMFMHGMFYTGGRQVEAERETGFSHLSTSQHPRITLFLSHSKFQNSENQEQFSHILIMEVKC